MLIHGSIIIIDNGNLHKLEKINKYYLNSYLHESYSNVLQGEMVR